MPARAKPEDRFSHYVKELLERVLLTPCWCTAIDCSGPMNSKNPHAGAMWMNRRRYIGIRDSHLDWYVFQHQKQTAEVDHYGPLGLWAQFELKVGKNKPTLGQLQTIEALRKQGMQSAVCWTLNEVFMFLNTMGFRMADNAGYVLKELNERYAAACREAEK